MKRRKGSKVVFIVIISIVSVLAVYLLLLLNTNSVVDFVEAVYRGEVGREAVPKCLESYDITEILPQITEVDAHITRRFVIHNFSEGYMWVKFTVTGYTADGTLDYGEANTSRWKIHKGENGWEVVETKDWWKTDSFLYKLRKQWQEFEKRK